MKSVLILGATSDIAEAAAKRFAEEQYRLILAGRNTNKLNIIKQDITIKFNIEVEIYYFDALDFSAHQNFCASLSSMPQITLCVFGYLGEQNTAERTWQEAWDILSTNFIGAVSILNIVANEYERKKDGCIIGVSSVAGERGRQSNYLYGSAKGGFSIYLEGLRNRLSKSNVHVLSVKPGFVATKMTEGLNLPKALTAKPDQVADAMFRGYKSRKNVIYILSIWRWIMLVIKMIPEPIFKKLSL